MNKITLILLTMLCLSLNIRAQTDVETIIEKAKQLHLEQKTAEAIAELNKAFVIEPHNADLYLTRADFNRFLDNKTDILNDAQKAALLAPTDRRVLYFSAQVLHGSQQETEALKIADQLIALGDVDRFGWSLRINIKMQLKDFVGAYEDVGTALVLFPKENMFKQNQAILIRLMGDSEKALEIYNAVIASSEKKLSKTKTEGEKAQIIRDLTDFYFSRAGYYFSKSNDEQARADLIKAVGYAPTDSNFYRRARIYRDQEMYAEAISDLTKSLEILKQFDKVSILIERGDVYVESGQYDEALQDYQEVLKLDATLKEVYDQRVTWIKQMRAK